MTGGGVESCRPVRRCSGPTFTYCDGGLSTGEMAPWGKNDLYGAGRSEDQGNINFFFLTFIIIWCCGRNQQIVLGDAWLTGVNKWKELEWESEWLKKRGWRGGKMLEELGYLDFLQSVMIN